MAALERHRVLLIDADQADAAWAAEILERAPSSVGRFMVSRAGTFADAATHLRRAQFDAVLLDLTLPDLQGVDAMSTVLSVAAEAAVVVLSTVDDERSALEAVLNGAQDYLIKGQGDGTSLRRAVRHAIERKRVERELHYLARFDQLTGLPNRLMFGDRLAQAVQRIDRHSRIVGLIFIDLDGFKAVNDHYGHAAGDQLLTAVATRLRRVVRRSDTVARLGGDEFTIILEGLRGRDDAERVAEEALYNLRQPFEIDGRLIELGASLGIAVTSDAAEAPDALTRRADAAMYRAKANGGTAYQLDVAA